MFHINAGTELFDYPKGGNVLAIRLSRIAACFNLKKRVSLHAYKCVVMTGIE